jgi:hypothetical protein
MSVAMASWLIELIQSALRMPELMAVHVEKQGQGRNSNGRTVRRREPVWISIRRKALAPELRHVLDACKEQGTPVRASLVSPLANWWRAEFHGG